LSLTASADDDERRNMLRHFVVSAALSPAAALK
jgi:hypothetical protein